MSKIRQKLGKNVKKYRKLRSMTQEALSFESRLHRAYVGGIERGERDNITLETLEKLAVALKVQPIELLS